MTVTPTSFMVIGSNCFTGSHIVDALLENPNNEVVGISRSPEYKPLFLPYKRHDNPRFEFRSIDLVRQFDELIGSLQEIQPQVVINVAALSEVALSHERPVEYFDTNTLGVVRLCDHLRRCAYLERYVHISSAEIFGTCPTPLTEAAPFRPSTPYAILKAAEDLYLNTLQENFDFPVTIIRSTNVYGPHQQLFKIIPRTAIYLKLGRTLELHGGGRAMKSFIHVRDVVAGVIRAIERGTTGTYHFTVPSDQSVADVVREVCSRMGRDFDTAIQVVEERLGQDARYWLDCSTAERELDWAPQVPLGQGIDEVVEWIEANWSQIQHEPLSYVHKV